MQPKEKPRPLQTSRGELCLFLSFNLDSFSAARQQVPQPQVPTVGQCFRHRERRNRSADPASDLLTQDGGPGGFTTRPLTVAMIGGPLASTFKMRPMARRAEANNFFIEGKFQVSKRHANNPELRRLCLIINTLRRIYS